MRIPEWSPPEWMLAVAIVGLIVAIFMLSGGLFLALL